MTSHDTDIYQNRYKNHQEKKKVQMIEIMKSRVSQRNYNGKEVEYAIIEQILKDAAMCPSSCNRQAVHCSIISDREDKEILGGLLVGGVGWVHRADKIILLFAGKEAYKAHGEIDFMPYLDAGVALYAIQLLGEEQGIGMAYVNPNIRERNKEYFNTLFNKENDIYCGAIACGYYDKKAPKTERKKSLLVK